MNIKLITLFPEMFEAMGHGIVGRAMDANIISLECINPRDFTHNAHRNVDDRPYGGGPGMVMTYQPLHDALQHTKEQLKSPAKTIHLSPQGQPLTHATLQQLSKHSALILVCSRYEGVDERFIEDDIDAEYSVGDFVVSGGELPAMLMIDGITRLLPGALGDAQSAQQDSFSEGLLDCPHYTRPEQINQKKVPKVLLSGDHQAIRRWRLKQSLGRTWQKRPDLLKRRVLGDEEQQLLTEFKNELEKSGKHDEQ